jgi:hypothetical protein
MAKLTIGRMAKLYGLHRSTLHEAVAKGRVSAGFDGKGQRVIDLTEMIRVYGEPPGPPLYRHTPLPDTSPTPSPDTLHPLLEELRLLREEVRELRTALLRLEHKPEPKASSPKPRQEPATWESLMQMLDQTDV